MDIIVCIKQVPDTTDVKIDPQTNTLVREGVRSVINPFDLYAIEEALRLREAHGGKVTVLTMGPPQALVSLREALAMGADDAALISDRRFAGSDTLATSYTLAQAIKRVGRFDLVICGKQATDGDTAQVGPGIAAHLNLAQVAFVKKTVEVGERSATFLRMTEEGHDAVRVPLPAVITVVKEINTPRYASLTGKVRARRMATPVWGPDDICCDEEKLGLDGSPTWVQKIFSPPVRKGQPAQEASDESITKVAETVAEYLHGK
ncbi:MAG TPA: electron transfer flavoprotein subunit beta/FixA family protein [bacterium]|nr:electron transfer flavoprotein subunit beta/FixA family protein [bacterium]